MNKKRNNKTKNKVENRTPASFSKRISNRNLKKEKPTPTKKEGRKLITKGKGNKKRTPTSFPERVGNI